ncbi:calcium-binding protein [Mesobacterium pallidum]|uniref:calcium-binding protein n=1 Tax=Mesobacterium pallidum TaxID=2872037 RepID=UPI001EE37599|nr:calcium-binding protein [Mesobacterium pallidum]
MAITTTFTVNSEVLRGLEGAFDFTPIIDFALDYEDALWLLGDSGAWTFTSIAASEIEVISDSGNVAILSGSGIGPVGTIAELEAAIDGGFATGEFDSLVFTDIDGLTEILELSFDASGIAITSGTQELVLDGALPGSFDDIWLLLDSVNLLSDPSALSQAEINDILDDLSATSLTGVTLFDDGNERAALSLPDGSVTLTLGEVTLEVVGEIGNDLGDLAETLLELMDMSQLYPRVRVYDGQGNEITSDGPGYDLWAIDWNNIDLHDWNNVIEGTVYVSVEGAEGSTGTYELMLSDGWDTWYAVDEAGFEYFTDTGDAADTWALAARLAARSDSYIVDINTSVFGEIDGIGDVDFYAIDFTDYNWLSIYADVPTFEWLLGQLSSLSVASATLSVGGEELVTLTGDILEALANGAELETIEIDGTGFENVALDLSVDGSSGNGYLFGHDGTDYMLGFSGADTIYGEDGGDFIDGGDQGDVIYAGLGADTVVGGSGADMVFLGAGTDIYYDSTQGSPYGDDTIYGGDGNDTVYGGGGAEHIEGGTGNDDLYGGKGADTIYGQGGADVINAGAWHDVVFGGDGTDLAYLGDGNDSYTDTSQGLSDTVWGGLGDDTIHGGAGGDDLRGQDGADVLTGANGYDTLYGGAQGDTLDGGAGNDVIAGGLGMDLAIMGTGNDTWWDDNQTTFGDDRVYAGGGWDTINAVGGDDTMTGGAGSDSFVFAATIGDMVITDYAVGEDDLTFAAALFGGSLTQAGLDALSDTTSGTLVLEFAGGGSITFEGLATNAGLLADIVLV